MTHVEDFPFVSEKLFEPTAAYDTPVLSRADEEEQMVCAESIEEGCSLGHECECMKMFPQHERFVMKRMTIHGTLTDLCVLCTRLEVLRMYLNARSNGIIPKRSIQPYRNIVGVLGEYDMRDCIKCDDTSFSGVREPFIVYSRDHYRSVVYDGVRRVVQDLTDFREGAAHATLAL
jgi:hypothetical protein